MNDRKVEKNLKASSAYAYLCKLLFNSYNYTSEPRHLWDRNEQGETR